MDERNRRVRERAAEGTLEERLAIRRGIYTAIGGIVDGFLARLDRDDFETATRRHAIDQRFGEGQVVLGEAIGKAFPQYARLARSRLGAIDQRSGYSVVPVREAEHTSRDPYRTIDYAIDDNEFDNAVASGFVESVVLSEALACYNEIVEMFHAGTADEVHELEDVRRRFQASYRDLVTLAELKAKGEPQELPPSPPQEPEPDPEWHEVVSSPSDVFERFLDFIWGIERPR